MWIIWLVIIVFALIAEAATVNMVSIWFAGGALAALASDLLNWPLWAQIVSFLVVSIVLLLIFIGVFKPRFDKAAKEKEGTNADRIIGNEAVVLETIDPLAGTGQIRVLNQNWSAVSQDRKQVISSASIVKVIAIEGVHAVVVLLAS